MMVRDLLALALALVVLWAIGSAAWRVHQMRAEGPVKVRVVGKELARVLVEKHRK